MKPTFGRNLKRTAVFALLLAIIFSLTAPVLATDGAENLKLSFTLSKAAIAPGEEMTVAVALANYDAAMTGLRAIGVEITWDADALEIVPGSPATLLTTSASMILTTAYNESAGMVVFTYMSPGKGTTLEKGKTGLFSFAVKAAGTADETIAMNVALKVADANKNTTVPVTNAPVITVVVKTEPPVVTPPVTDDPPTDKPPVTTDPPVVAPPVTTKPPTVTPPAATESPTDKPPVKTESPTDKPPVTTGPPTEPADKPKETAPFVNPFTDVKENDWFYADVAKAYLSGLIKGTSAATFSPDNNLTYAEAVTLAARMHRLYTSREAEIEAGVPWHQPFVDYAKANGVIDRDYDWNAAATRAGYIEIFANALPEAALPAINSIPDGSIPDVPANHPNAAAIYKLYRAGIVQGVDAAHNCNPDSNIRRSEVAAIINRMTDSEARIEFGM